MSAIYSVSVSCHGPLSWGWRSRWIWLPSIVARRGELTCFTLTMTKSSISGNCLEAAVSEIQPLVGKWARLTARKSGSW